MKTRPVISVVASAVLLAVGLVGCSSPTSSAQPSDPSRAVTATPASSEPSEARPLPTGLGGTPRPGLPKDVDWSSADAVGKAALTVMWTEDTLIDASQYDATLRAVPYLTAEYGAMIKSTPPLSGPDAQWQSWEDYQAWTTVTLEPADEFGRPSDTPTRAYRQWNIAATPHNSAGWSGEPVEAAAFVALVRSTDGDAWKVSEVSIQ